VDLVAIKPAEAAVVKKEMQYLAFSSLYLQMRCTFIEQVK
jgi:hypothetical protein